jgi:hypothetical protein
MNPIKAHYDRMPAGFRSSVRSLIPDSILRWYAHRNTDVYLISYPKCGRTWLRLMIGKAITQTYSLPETEEGLFLRWNKRPHPDIPRIRVIHDDRPMLRSPTELENSKIRYRGKRVIFLVRDPRDVVVSSYFEMKNRGRLFGDNPYEDRKPVYEGSLPDFIRREQGGFQTILRFYNIWAANREIPRAFLLVRYEDLRIAPQIELRRVIDFLGLDAISDQTLVEAVEFASFDNMRRMESDGKFETGILNPADQSDPDSFKTRKGKVRGYLEVLAQDEIDYMNQKIEEGLSPIFGYAANLS